MGKIKVYNNFTWGLNSNTTDAVWDKDLVIAENVFYNPAWQLQTRRGYTTFWNQIGSNPITSYFFFQRDDDQTKVALCSSGTNMYRLTSGTWNSIASNLIEYETLPWQTTKRTRRDYTVYKNVVYMCDWVNPYCKYWSNVFAQIGVSASVTATVDSTTDVFTKAGHNLSVNDEIYFTTSGTMPWWVTAYQVYFVASTPTGNTFTISTTPNWTALDVTSNWTGTLNFFELTEPRTRYITINQWVCRSTGEDKNPISLYYSAALTWLSNLDNINTNVAIIWPSEDWVINWLGEYAQGALVLKSNKVYYTSLATGSFTSYPIDAQAGGYADRAINNVWNSLVYFNERWIDSLVKRTGVDGAGALESQALSTKIRELINSIEANTYNSSCGQYVKESNNYHFMFDSNGDDVPDTMVVYSSLTGGRTTYTFPEIYDFGTYIDDDWNKQYLFASANGGQMYQYDYWFDDNGTAIEATVQTKSYDFWEWMFEYIDIEGRKQEGENITATILIDNENIGEWLIEDSDLTTSNSIALWVNPLATVPIWGSGSDDLELFRFKVRIPFMVRWSNIAVKLNSTWVQRILEKVTVNHNQESYDMFAFNSIK